MPEHTRGTHRHQVQQKREEARQEKYKASDSPMTPQRRDCYECKSQTCEDNGGTCIVEIPEGYESPQDCVNTKSFTDNEDKPDCKWVLRSRPAPAAPDPEWHKFPMIRCERLKKHNATIRNQTLEEVIKLIRAREKNANDPNGWLWQQPILVDALNSLRHSKDGEQG